MNSKVAAFTVSEKSINTFTNCFNQDQGRKNVGPDLDPNCLTLWCFPERFLCKKMILKKISRRQKVWKIAQNALFVWFDSLRPINNLSVIKGWVFLGWTSTKLGLMFLLKDTTQWRRWGSNPRSRVKHSATEPVRSHRMHWVKPTI